MTTAIILYLTINLVIIAVQEPLTSQSPWVNYLAFIVLFFTALPIFGYKLIHRYFNL